MNATAFTSRKVLLPLATLLAAGAVAVGSGATWTSTTDASVAVTGGLLSQDNDKAGAVLTLTDIKPGDSMEGTVTVTNDGNVDSTLDLAVAPTGANFGTFSDFLEIKIVENGVTIYDDPFNDLNDAAPVGFDQTDIDFNVGDTVTYVITVTLVNNTTGTAEEQNADQGKTAGATFTWKQTQVDGESLFENWI